MVLRNFFNFFAIVLTGVLLCASTPALAWGDHDDRRDRREDRREDRRWEHYSYRNHPSYGFRFSFIPNGCFSIRLGRERFYYNDGVYFRYYNGDYVLVQPPVGAIVRRIPVDYRSVIINGVTYYTDNGVYYVYTPGGYQVVPAPVTYVQAPAPVYQTAPVTVVQPATAPAANVTLNNDETYTINIPNEKSGGYTEVTIKRAEKGFVGPQGEFYADFPRVFQLKAMYAR